MQRPAWQDVDIERMVLMGQLHLKGSRGLAENNPPPRAGNEVACGGKSGGKNKCGTRSAPLADDGCGNAVSMKVDANHARGTGGRLSRLGNHRMRRTAQSGGGMNISQTDAAGRREWACLGHNGRHARFRGRFVVAKIQNGFRLHRTSA